jgi:hypothetical protein
VDITPQDLREKLVAEAARHMFPLKELNSSAAKVHECASRYGWQDEWDTNVIKQASVIGTSSMRIRLGLGRGGVRCSGHPPLVL